MLRKMLGSVVAAVFLATSIIAADAQTAPTVTLAAPANLGSATISGASGTSYTPNAKGQIAVTNADDAAGFLKAGWFLVIAGTTPPSLRFFEGKNSDGTTLAASAAAGKFGLALTAGTSEVLNGEAAQGNTKTDTVAWEIVLPSTYVAGQNLTITVNAAYSGSGTAGTKTVAAHAYLTANDGTQGSDLVTTSATTISATKTAYAFTVPAAGLAAGARLVITIVGVMQETGGSATLTLAVNSVTVG